MIGIVLVSHSPKLAEAALELAREMAPGEEPRVALAAGTNDGRTGTDATRVAEAIAEVASPDGVLVLMDLGSAVLSAELALEFAGDTGGEVRLSSAPVVEGLLAAVVRARGGASLDEADREARAALGAKQSQLGDNATPAVEATPASGSDVTERFVITNAEGLHARPASLLVGALGGLDVRVTVASGDKKPVDGRSPIGLMALGVRAGDEITVTASGPQAADAMAAIRALVADSFGE
ncbi:MAG TPA: dihydroxyacetone kinase phosphoryl donor subunit DhaM [Pseudolysinimonas sp.]|jgi:dihydroxyacetone kinase phosphotransfer subunit|nr:dihydroxyacetone kinase phosphoryl donor subunit DhaM [Pseudolysinimonas sp.]